MRLNTPQTSCPICQSDITYTFQLIYQSILNNNFSKMLSDINIKFKGARDKSKFKQIMLERTSLPPKPRISSFELFIAVFGGVVGMFMGIIVNDIIKAILNIQMQPLIATFTIIGYLKALQISYRHTTLKKKLVWEKKVTDWEKSRICLKCGGDWQE